MPVAAAVVGSVAGGIMSSNASKKSAKVQAQSAQQANQLTQAQYDQTRKDLMPYNQAGVNSMAALQNGLTGSPKKTVGGIGGQDLMRSFGMKDFNADPGYQFRKQEGMDGLQSQAAASGGLLSGATLKALTQYNGNIASQEYGNAYNRFSTDQGNQFSRLYNLANMGQNSAAQTGNAGAMAAQQMGNNMMQGANSQAAGIIGSNNAYANMIGQIGSLGAGAMQSKQNTGVWV